MKSYTKIIFLLFLGILSKDATGQINVSDNQTAQQLAEKLTGSGVNISNATLNCSTVANGIFNVVSSNLGLDSGIVLTSGRALTDNGLEGINGPESLEPSNDLNMPGDNDLNILSGQATEDACILEFDFIPAGDTIRFDYVFGSVEYQDFSCSSFNDVFGFLISGPGYTNPTNIAVIPGTNIPVTVNSTTDPVINDVDIADLPDCQAMGPGSPFSQYYIDNQLGTTISYRGFTTILTAVASVQPCSTYHLKLAIADADDANLDSGVFLKAGSLSSTDISVTSIGGGGLIAPEPYCVRECLPGEFKFTLGEITNFDYVIKFDLGGSAIMGYDYTPIPDSIIIPAGQMEASLFINGLAVPPVGPKDVFLYVKSPFNCSGITYLDTAKMVIYDSLYAKILTPDTAICRLQSAQIISVADAILSIQWVPGTTLDNDAILNPIASPTSTTTYTMIASLPGSGCPPVHNSVTISIAEEPIVNIGSDLAICLGNSYQFQPTITPSNQTYAFTWSPGTDLDNTTISNATTTPTADITYYLMATPTNASCPGYDTVLVHVIPNAFTLENPDTAICEGESIQVRANGPAEFAYHWTPSTGVSDPFQIDPVITPQESSQFSITASHIGCPDIVHSFYVDVQPIPHVFLGPDKEICQWHPLDIEAEVAPEWYTHYSYDWNVQEDVIDHLNPYHVKFHGDADAQVIVNVTTPIGCASADTMNIMVHPGNFGTASPIAADVCPGETVQLTATGGVTYKWTPDLFLTDATSANPVASPVSDMLYGLLITDQYGCTDTFQADLVVHSATVTSLPDSVHIWPGETYQINPGGNALYYKWFPAAGLSDDDISNPVASPKVNTRYYVEARSESGCIISDSIDVLVNTESVLDVPNAFIPGTDVNKEFKIVKKGTATLEYFRVFNRWGQMVFETKDIDKGWDGTFNGEPQPIGVYVYMVEAFTGTKERFYKQGNVTLIR
jgi:gliding motility-associated-like protein